MSERNYWQYGESWYTKYLYLPLTHKEFTFSLHDFPFLLKPILVLNVYSHWTFRYLWLLLYIFIRILVYRWRNWGAQGIRLTDSTLHACSLPAGIVWLHTLKDSLFNVSVIHQWQNVHCPPKKIIANWDREYPSTTDGPFCGCEKKWTERTPRRIQTRTALTIPFLPI